MRSARLEDAPQAVDVLRRSISALCREDHQNDAATLEYWLANKRVDRFEGWIAAGGHDVLVAERDRTLVGVGLLYEAREIQLCYVNPGAERHGVGRALLLELEARARRAGAVDIRLWSTGSARRFYERCGYRSAGERKAVFGVLVGYPYVKELAAVEGVEKGASSRETPA